MMQKKKLIQWVGIPLCLAAVCVAVEWVSFGLNALDWSVPMLYGGDGISGVEGMKNALTGCENLLGWPFHEQASPYEPNFSMLYTLFCAFCGLFTKNYGVAFNLYLLVIPVANSLVCYFVLHSFQVRAWLAAAGALLFGFCPYVQQRLGGHMGLAACECAPLALLLCLWCVEDKRFNRPGKGFLHVRRNWLALGFAWLIANNGMVYYPYFTCFFLCITALCLLLKTRDWKSLAAPFVTVCEIVGWLAVSFAPMVLGLLLGAGSSVTAGADRGSIGGDIYGLRISSLLLSPKGYGFSKIADWVVLYRERLASSEGVMFNENSSGYLGVVAILGFLLLLALLFANHRWQTGHEPAQTSDRLWLLARLNIGALLLCTISGFGAIISIAVRMIRGYTRISGYLALIGIFAVVLCAEGLLQRLKRAPKKQRLAVLAIAAVFLYSFWEQSGYFRPDYAGVQAAFSQDKAFVGQIEQTAGSGGMIYQLPYMKSFENGQVNKMADYTLYRGVLHSDTLRWSYGAPYGSENDLWNKATSELPANQMVSELKAQGFAGIYLDRDGYEPADWQLLEQQLCAAAGAAEPQVNESGTVSYIALES